MLEVRGIDGASDPMAAVGAYLSSLSDAVQSRVLLAGVRAYLRVLRSAAASSSPYADFKSAKNYRMAARLRKRGDVSGYLYVAPPGNVIEAGFGGHYAPVLETEQDGQTMAGVLRWLQRHEPALYAKWMEHRRRPFRFIKTKTRQGTPWVRPAAEGAEGAAAAAFEQAVIDAIGKEVK
jgi:hypothetical protein